MTARANYLELAPEAFKILMRQESYLALQFEESEAVSSLTWELIKLRVSLINQCAFCIDMHSKDSLKLGESYKRIIGLSAWRDMPFYSESEKIVFDMAEKLTLGRSVDDAFYQKICQYFSDKDVVNLTLAINAINSWNRIAKIFKPEVGSY